VHRAPQHLGGAHVSLHLVFEPQRTWGLLGAVNAHGPEQAIAEVQRPVVALWGVAGNPLTRHEPDGLGGAVIAPHAHLALGGVVAEHNAVYHSDRKGRVVNNVALLTLEFEHP